MKHSTLSHLLALVCALPVHAQEPATVQVGDAPKAGEVSIGGPLTTRPEPGAPTGPSASGTGGLPLIGGEPTNAHEPGKVVPVYTTMQAAARAGVNPMAAASAPKQSVDVTPMGPLSITDETIWGRITALPFGFKVGALLLLGVAGYALREWKRN